MKNIQLGCGLVAMGRMWGYKQDRVISDQEAQLFLEKAFELGIRYFDTAPAYGLSEERLGRFLASLTEAERQTLTIATKFGEHWDPETQTSYVDHSLAALKASVEQSLARLGRIDILQLHKATPTVLASKELHRAWEWVRSLGITQFGASVSDLEAGEMSLKETIYSHIQLPYNRENTSLESIITQSRAHHKKIVINRPFNMGKDMYSEADNPARVAFEHILKLDFDGVILTGTTQVYHLMDNIEIFNQVRQDT